MGQKVCEANNAGMKIAHRAELEDESCRDAGVTKHAPSVDGGPAHEAPEEV